MSTTIPKARTSQEEGPKGRAKGTIGPWQGKAAKPGLLDIVQLDHIDKSPSGTQYRHLKKTKQLGSPLQTSIWGPQQSWSKALSTSCGSQLPCRKMERGVIPCKNPQQKNVKSGLCGGDVGSTHLTGGGSWWESQG